LIDAVWNMNARNNAHLDQKGLDIAMTLPVRELCRGELVLESQCRFSKNTPFSA
jgi:hypothetical protein